jgi:hypothetical protein
VLTPRRMVDSRHRLDSSDESRVSFDSARGAPNHPARQANTCAIRHGLNRKRELACSTALLRICGGSHHITPDIGTGPHGCDQVTARVPRSCVTVTNQSPTRGEGCAGACQCLEPARKSGHGSETNWCGHHVRQFSFDLATPWPIGHLSETNSAAFVPAFRVSAPAAPEPINGLRCYWAWFST